jgi:prepilin-type N-terminal cleavage/methylation domain-containing protein
MNSVKSDTARQPGFSTIEMAIVLVIIAIIISIAIPVILTVTRASRASADARKIATQLARSKMRAAQGFTQTRLNCDLAGNSCQPEICTTKGTSTCTTFTAEGGPVLLSDGTTFSFGSITTPAGSQSVIQNTGQMVFNSRSLPIDGLGASTGEYAIYITNNSNTYAVSVFASGRVAVWRYGNGTWTVQ